MIEYRIVEKEDYDNFFDMVDAQWGLCNVFPDGMPESFTCNFWTVHNGCKFIGYIGLEYGEDDNEDEVIHFHTAVMPRVPMDVRVLAMRNFQKYAPAGIIGKMPYRRGMERIMRLYGFSNIKIEDNYITGEFTHGQ